VGDHRADVLSPLEVNRMDRDGGLLQRKDLIMGRRVRHIQARPGEWVKVHRPRRRNNSDDYGWIIILIILVILFRGC
jgi:hypothetical protein